METVTFQSKPENLSKDNVDKTFAKGSKVDAQLVKTDDEDKLMYFKFRYDQKQTKDDKI